MEQGNIIQVFRYRTLADGTRLVQDIWEIGAATSTNALASVVSAAYVDGSDDTYEVMTRTGEHTCFHPLCWDTPPRCRKERLCVVLKDPARLEDFRSYCVDFFS